MLQQRLQDLNTQRPALAAETSRLAMIAMHRLQFRAESPVTLKSVVLDGHQSLMRW
jgi:hypothetical protein